VGSEAAASAGQTAEQKLALAHQALLHTHGIQFDFKSVPPQPPPPEWAKAIGEILRVIAPVLAYAFWGGLILGALFIVYLVLREVLPDLGPKRRTRVEMTDWRPAAEQARALIEDADSLASQGRFEEAMHLLLFRSIDDLAGRRPGLVKPALTSRDLAALQGMPEDARDAFERLAQAVEMTFFGGRPAGEAAFGAARADYEAFAFAEGWR
jgi:hypothetical protein